MSFPGYRLPNIKNKRLLDPHVVIIGAGASLAACPIDKNGKKVPLLSNIHKLLGLTELLQTYNFSQDELEDFELLYSKVAEDIRYGNLKNILENKVFEYFYNLQLPDTITIYDYLILSLTSKDLIISFNWDPFLLQAYVRNLKVKNLPQVVFPHGNVGMGVCSKCRVKGYSNSICLSCGKPLKNVPLLFPINKKNYRDIAVIKSEWTVAEIYLSRAVGITIFGYGAPDSDREAYELLKNSYKKSNSKPISRFSIINIASEEANQKHKWEDIFDDRMASFYTDFKQSILWRAPRISLESVLDAILQQSPRDNIQSFKEFTSLEELQNFACSINTFDMAI